MIGRHAKGNRTCELRKEGVHWLLDTSSVRLQDAKNTSGADVAQDWNELPKQWKARILQEMAVYIYGNWVVLSLTHLESRNDVICIAEMRVNGQNTGLGTHYMLNACHLFVLTLNGVCQSNFSLDAAFFLLSLHTVTKRVLYISKELASELCNLT